MLNNQIKDYLKYLFLCSSEPKFSMCNNIDLEKFLSTSKKNRVANILFYGLPNINKQNEIVEKELKTECMIYGIKSMHQDIGIKQIFDKLEKNNIRVTVMKGYVLKNLYLHKDMRVMGDIDFIVEKKDYNKAKSIILDELGFKRIDEDNSELCAINENKVCIELHQHLVTELSKNQTYFDSHYKEHLVKISNYYVLDEEFHFIYMMDHMYKHFIEGGLGLKYLLDFALYIKKYPNIIYKTLTEIKKLKLDGFVVGLLIICRDYLGFNIEEDISLFSREPNEESIDTLLLMILRNGEYGTIESRVHAKTIHGTMFKRTIKRIFPPIIKLYKNTRYYPLKVIFYPFRLIVFWFNFIFGNIKYIRKVFSSNKNIEEDQKESLKNMYKEMK